MNALKLLPVFLSTLLMGAHFLRVGFLPLVVLVLMFPIILFFRKPWAARLVQVFLILGALEWTRTLFLLIHQRQALGLEWTRLAIILGLVAVFTGTSSLVFLSRSLKERYRLTK